MPAPDFVLPSGGGIAYGEFHLDLGSLAWLLKHLPDVPDALTRGAAWLAVWDAMLNGEAPPDRVLALAMRSVAVEKDELNVQRELAYLAQAYWRFLEPDQRIYFTGDFCSHLLKWQEGAALSAHMQTR